MRITPRRWPSIVFNRRSVFLLSMSTSKHKDADNLALLTPPRGVGLIYSSIKTLSTQLGSSSSGSYDICQRQTQPSWIYFVQNFTIIGEHMELLSYLWQYIVDVFGLFIAYA